ncbi:hypothetical protein NIES267_71900 (plasmid) [Calothrix parasitica NIES-267]|uniref:Uncharacterized protein n=1 Tax=Calothrix parasitica NIES-267 TaxID=1973488 RepID=A0A1Z4M2H6_9CYAN|nr:hypothetical protein NIES267_71900 [Calothrix parasitica NIES-267]
MSRHLKLLPRALILLVSGVIALPLNPSIAQTTEEAGLMKLMRGMLSLSSDTKVIVGKLPEKMPVKLPIPLESQIVGSTIDDKGNISIVLETSQPIEKVSDFYKRNFKNSAWVAARFFRFYRGGFITNKSELEGHTTFCNNNKSMSLYLDIQEIKATSTSVRLSLYKLNKTEEKEKSSSNACQISDTIDIYENRVSFPVLIPPPNTEISKTERNYGESIDSLVILKTKLDGNTLANHYNPQLEKAAWKKIDSGESDSYIWSTWTFKDEKGQNIHAVLSFTKIQGKPNQYFANLNAFKP